MTIETTTALCDYVTYAVVIEYPDRQGTTFAYDAEPPRKFSETLTALSTFISQLVKHPSHWRWYDALREWPAPRVLRAQLHHRSPARRCLQHTCLAQLRRAKRRRNLHRLYGRA